MLPTANFRSINSAVLSDAVSEPEKPKEEWTRAALIAYIEKLEFWAEAAGHDH